MIRNCLTCRHDEFVSRAELVDGAVVETTACQRCGDANPVYQRERAAFFAELYARETPQERLRRERFGRRIQAAVDGRELKLVP